MTCTVYRDSGPAHVPGRGLHSAGPRAGLATRTAPPYEYIVLFVVLKKEHAQTRAWVSSSKTGTPKS